MNFTLVIPDAPPSLNVLLRMHWRDRAALAKNWQRQVWYELCQVLDRPFKPLERASVTIERRSPRMTDADNCYGACKVCVDALKVAGVIIDDSPEHIALIVTQARGTAQTTIHVEWVR